MPHHEGDMRLIYIWPKERKKKTINNNPIVIFLKIEQGKLMPKKKKMTRVSFHDSQSHVATGHVVKVFETHLFAAPQHRGKVTPAS